MQSNRKIVMPLSLLATLVGLARSQVDDIASGVEDGTYDEAENLALPAQTAAVEAAEAMLQEADGNPPNLTGLLLSLDDGESWVTSGGVRLSFHDADEDDDEMADLLVNVTTEGIILDLSAQGSGEVRRTACLNINSLVALTT